MSRLKGLPRSHLYRILRKGEVRVNKGRVKPSRRLQAGDVVRVPPLRLAASAPPAAIGEGLRELLSDAVLYEDEGLLVLNKPSGLAVHGGSGTSLGVIEALRQIRPDERRLELVHRIDKDTSGCLMVAKSRTVLK
ncbi:23S rRNA pseudouridine(955/2504/2580) synthase, partial [bacterium]|nr:23S rRNA pseudouridine(955/2504/2580) synthase [bacterium]